MQRITIRGVFYPSPDRSSAADGGAPRRARILLSGQRRWGRMEMSEVLLVNDAGSSIDEDGDFYPDAPPPPPDRL